MPYRPMAESGGGGGPIPEKTQGWLWGSLWGYGAGLITALILYVTYG